MAAYWRLAWRNKGGWDDEAGEMTGQPRQALSEHGLLAGFDTVRLRRLIARIDAAPLFAHAYSHHLNLRFGGARPHDLLEFAAAHGLCGLKIHVEDGEAHSLLRMDGAARQAFGATAAALGLTLHVETSSTARAELADAIAIAADIDARSVRSYPRYEGRVSEIIAQTIADLKLIPELDPDRRFRFTLEQHEDLKSCELVEIVRAVGNPLLTLLFDFGNMTNAFERPEEALEIQSPWITEVHVKDVKILDDRGGWAHLACRSGEGDISFHALLRDLLLLGEREAQVTAIALEEENGMYAPAYRFPDEPADPFIPARAASVTDLPEDESLAERLSRERREAAEQVVYVRKVLAELRALAAAEIKGLGGGNSLPRPVLATQEASA